MSKKPAKKNDESRNERGFIVLKRKTGGKGLMVGVTGKKNKPVYEADVEKEHLKTGADSFLIPFDDRGGKSILTDVGDYVMENGILHAMNMNVGRSIMLIEDGLKSVERRVLITMFNSGLKPTSPRIKVSGVVGNMMSTVYPHGDQASETIFRLGRESAMMFPYIDGKGNFGGVVSSEHAANRYAEARLSKYAMDCFFSESDVRNPIYDTHSSYQYDGLEPTYLPTKYPNILMNWNMGIGKGAYVYVAAFNPTDVFETTLKLMDDPEAKINIYPDCQVPIDIVNKSELKGCFDMYSFPVKVRGRFHTETQIGKDENGRKHEKNCIVFTSCPITTNGAAIEDAIIKIRKNDGKGINRKDSLQEIIDINQATAINPKTGRRDPNMLELTIDYERGYDPNVIAEKLFKMTPLAATLPVKYNLIRNNKPEKCTPRKLVLEWLEVRRDQKRRYFQQKIQQAAEARDTAEALLIIYRQKKVNEMINIIKSTKSDVETVHKLSDTFGITEHQAYVLSNKRLKSLNGQNVDQLKEQFKQACDDYDKYSNLCNADAIDDSIREDLREGLKKYGRPRMARLLNLKSSSLDDADEKKVIIYNREMYYCIKSYDDISSIANKIDKTYDIKIIKNSDTLAVVGTNGKLKRLDGFAFGYNTSGVAFTQLGLPAVASIFQIIEDSSQLLAFVTKAGYGKVMPMTECSEKISNAKIMKINAGDELIGVVPVEDGGILGMVQDDKMYYLHVKELPVLKRASAGNWLLKSNKDACISTCIYIPKSANYLMIYGESGYAKILMTSALVQKTTRKSNACITMSGKAIYYAVPMTTASSTIKLYSGKGKQKIDISIDKNVVLSGNGKTTKTALSTSIASPTKVFKVGKHEFYRIK